ncbi:tail assembly protein [Enterobacter huaxiensis]|uniref:tail assembly protein n=1 Tax=Enterobacter huaxiensis TaxID=2494702 RepID=UPI002175F585|nr:tail assembly protein [Enterobacter huaxiensis]MCS5452490.1 tail assembly protein [Enterobacter huaxiensis]
MLKTILLSGSLAKLFGREHKLDVQTPIEAIKALSVIKPGFEHHFMTAHLRGIRFAIFKDSLNIGMDECKHDSGAAVIRIVPVIAGSKRAGVFQTILGAVMVVAGLAISYFTGGTASAVGMAMAKFGAAMMVGGVMQMMAPQPPGLASRQDQENLPSYAFGGPVNSTAQGVPIGVAYGTREIGGAILSGSITTTDFH